MHSPYRAARRRLLCALGASFACAGLVVLAAAPFAAGAGLGGGRAQPRAALGNPVAGNYGFTVFVHADAAMHSNENEGTMALGGNLSLTGNYRVVNHPPTAPFVVPGDAQPTGLLIGGAIDWAGSAPTGYLQVLSSAYVKLGSAAGTDIINTGSPTQLVPTGAGAGSAKQLILTTQQPTNSVVASGLIDFDAAFAAYKQRSDAMAACPDTIALTDANGNPLTAPYPPQVYLTLSTTHTNVWTINAADFSGIQNITLRNLPTASSPLVVNVVNTGGAYAWNPATLAGFSGAAAPFVLWNFPDATTVTMTGANSIDGTVYTPSANDVNLDSGNIQGNVIAAAFTHGGGDIGVAAGEVHDFQFAGNVDCEAPSPSPSASASESPSEEESPSPSAMPSPSCPTPSVTGAGPGTVVPPTGVPKTCPPASPGGGLAATGAPPLCPLVRGGLACVLIGASLLIISHLLRRRAQL